MALSFKQYTILQSLGYYQERPFVDFESFQKRAAEMEAKELSEHERAIINRVYNYFPDELPQCMERYLVPNEDIKKMNNQLETTKDALLVMMTAPLYIENVLHLAKAYRTLCEIDHWDDPPEKNALVEALAEIRQRAIPQAITKPVEWPED